MIEPDEEEQGGFASPPCFLHEVDPLYAGLGPKSDEQQRLDVLRWRRSTRELLIGRRLALDSGLRRQYTEGIGTALDTVLGDVAGRCISLYWPFKGEPDLRDWLGRAISRGAKGALPVVAQRQAQLVFQTWRPGDRLEPGVWNIPVPIDGESVVPDVVIAPLVGYDAAGYRLGYGGGYYDRTLAELPHRPVVLGVGFSVCEVVTIYPLSHDIPMDAIITEGGVSTTPPFQDDSEKNRSR